MASPRRPPGAAPPTQDSNAWYRPSCVELGRPRRSAVSRATSQTPVSVRRPHSHASADRANERARAATSGVIDRVSSGTKVDSMSAGSARFVREIARLSAMSSPKAAIDSCATATHPTCRSIAVKYTSWTSASSNPSRRPRAVASRQVRTAVPGCRPNPRSATIDSPPRSSANRILDVTPETLGTCDHDEVSRNRHA